MRRPLLCFVGAAALLIALTIPALSMVTQNRALEQLPRSTDVRVGTALLTSRITGVGQGREGSIDVLVRPAGGSADELARRITAKLGDDPLITKATVEPVAGGLLVVGYLGVDPESSQAVDVLVPRVRTMVAHEAAGSRGVEADVDGVSAFNHDLNEEVGGDLWKVMGLVLVLCYLVLLVLLRSVLLPLKAVIMNLLSIGAAFGVIVMVFQWGWLDFTGYHSLGHINTLNPALMLAITFGLAMDYEVFLLSRIRERYVEHRRQRAGGRGGAGVERPDHHLGRADHDHGVRQLRADRRAGDQGDRAGPGGRDLHRRYRHAAGAGARGDAAAGRVELVDAGLARPDPAARGLRAARVRPARLTCFFVRMQSLLFIVLGIVIGGLAALAALRGRMVTLQRELAHERDGSGERLAQLLRASNEQLLQLHNESMTRQQAESRNELEKREKAVADMVRPLSDSLTRVDGRLERLDRDRVQTTTMLQQQLRTMVESQDKLRGETGALVAALRKPQTRGRWGELQLRASSRWPAWSATATSSSRPRYATTTAQLRPDLIVRLPGGKQVVVDAKAPLEAFLDAYEATRREQRDAQLAVHARQVREHVRKLSAKGYWSQFADAPDFVVMFLPGEMFFSAALEQDPSLIEQGVAQRCSSRRRPR